MTPVRMWPVLDNGGMTWATLGQQDSMGMSGGADRYELTLLRFCNFRNIVFLAQSHRLPIFIYVLKKKKVQKQ